LSNRLVDILQLVERLHRRSLDVVKQELDRLGIEDVNNVQALILFNIGPEDRLTVNDLTQRGYYLGSNVSYNVKKLTESGCLIQERSEHDRRTTRVRLSPRGLEIAGLVSDLQDRQARDLAEGGIDDAVLAEVGRALAGIERYWRGIDLPGSGR